MQTLIFEDFQGFTKILILWYCCNLNKFVPFKNEVLTPHAPVAQKIADQR